MKNINIEDVMVRMSIYCLGVNISMTEAAKSAVKAATRELCSFNRVVKDIKSAQIYPLLADVLNSVGVKSKEELTVANIKSLIAPCFFKSVEKDGEKKEVICTIRCRYEVEEAALTDAEGKPLLNKEGKQRKQKVTKLDEYGEKVVKDYQLCEIHTWNIQTLLNLLAQSKVIRDGKVS